METSQIDDGATVIASIRSGQYDDELDAICEVANARRRFAQVSGVQSLAYVGARVKFVRGRPRYLIGELATVVKVMQTWIEVKLDQDCGKFSAKSTIRTPMSIVEVVK